VRESAGRNCSCESRIASCCAARISENIAQIRPEYAVASASQSSLRIGNHDKYPMAAAADSVIFLLSVILCVICDPKCRMADQ